MSAVKNPVVFKDYPYWEAEDLQHVKTQIRQICNVRKDDIAQISNLINVFVGGRKVGKVPSSSIDVVATDRLNDINWDNSYLYILIDNAGTAEWRRAALGSW